MDILLSGLIIILGGLFLIGIGFLLMNNSDSCVVRTAGVILFIVGGILIVVQVLIWFIPSATPI